MSAASDYLEKKLLDHLLVNTAFTPAGTLYIGLFTADPGESGAASEFAFTGGYARIPVTNNETNFPPCAVTGTPTKSNGTMLSFPTASAAWGTAAYWAIYDDDGTPAGNMLAHGALATPAAIAIGNTPKIAIGALSFTIGNAAGGGLTDYAKRKLLDLTFGGTAYTPPATIYTGLATALSGETLTEWSDALYARQVTAFTAATLGAGTCPNTAIETYVGAGAAAGPTIITHYGVWDDLASGNLLACGPLSVSKTIDIGDTADLAAGAAIVTFQ